jgi:hypothetical protein
MVLRLLELSRQNGYRLHFFASNRVLRAFGASVEAILNEGHDLDWLCKYPANPAKRFQEASELFAQFGHKIEGLAVRGSWPLESAMTLPDSIRFVSAHAGPSPSGPRFFPVQVRGDREAVRSGISARTWIDSVRATLRESATLNSGVTWVVRPQVLAKIDPKLTLLRDTLQLAIAVGQPIRTLRQLMAEPLG